MLGLFMGVVNLVAAMPSMIRQSNSDAESRARARREGSTEYFNYHGECRDTQNNHKIHIYQKQGEVHRLDLKTWEDTNLSRQRAVSDGYSTIMLTNDTHYHDTIKGVRYQDKVTGRILVVRDFQHAGQWFMDVNSGDIIRPIDSYFRTRDEKSRKVDEELVKNMRKPGGRYDRTTDPYANRAAVVYGNTLVR